MGLCKSCNIVKNANSMKDGVCFECDPSLDSNNRTIEDIEKAQEELDQRFKKGDFTIYDIENIKISRVLDSEQKLDVISDLYIKEGYEQELRTERELKMIKRKKFSFLWSVLWFLFFGIGLLIYIFYYMSKKDEIIYIRIDKTEIENKEIDLITVNQKEKNIEIGSNEASTHDKLIKLAKMVEDELLTKEEFKVQKDILLAIK